MVQNNNDSKVVCFHFRRLNLRQLNPVELWFMCIFRDGDLRQTKKLRQKNEPKPDHTFGCAFEPKINRPH